MMPEAMAVPHQLFLTLQMVEAMDMVVVAQVVVVVVVAVKVQLVAVGAE